MAGLLAGLLLATGVARADDSLVLGILADRDPAAVRAHYRPLAAYLEAQLPGIGLVLEVLDLEAIDRAVAHRRLDLVITMPNHYLELRSHSSLTGPLATQLRLAGDTAVSALGGVMIARAERADIATLADLRAEPFDPATVSARMRQHRERFAVRFEMGQAVLVTHLAGMSAAERHAYADRLEERIAAYRAARDHHRKP